MAGKSGEAADGAAAAAGSDLNCGGSLGTSHPEKGKAMVVAVDNQMGSSSEERVEQMMANLCLTVAESSAVVIDDTNDLNWWIQIRPSWVRFWHRMCCIFKLYLQR
jgi:hypothetical protein